MILLAKSEPPCQLCIAQVTSHFPAESIREGFLQESLREICACSCAGALRRWGQSFCSLVHCIPDEALHMERSKVLLPFSPWRGQCFIMPLMRVFWKLDPQRMSCLYTRPLEHGVWLSGVNVLCHRARAHCQQRRSLVSPNQGFWRSLCAFEEQLGITERQAHLLSMIHSSKPKSAILLSL